MNILETYNKEWEVLNKSGNFEKAEELYYRNILPITTEAFKNKFAHKLEDDTILISILGFSPEPIILTAAAMSPDKHIICTTEHNKKVVNHYRRKHTHCVGYKILDVTVSRNRNNMLARFKHCAKRDCNKRCKQVIFKL